MYMNRTLHRRSLRLITILVVISMLLSPTASLASCCCVLAKVGQATGLSSIGCCDSVKQASCCESRIVDRPSTQRSCCSGRDGAQAAPTDCDCERSCCDGVNVLNAAVTSEIDSLRLGALTSEASFLFVSYDFIPTTCTLGIDSSHRFLSAQQCCATLCRWLN